jgi:membrane protease YdiL (CAAX protease family)
MMHISSEFQRYVEAAREGKMALWRTFAGTVIILAAFLATTLLGVLIAYGLDGIIEPPVAGAPGRPDAEAALQDLLDSPLGMVCTLASFAGLIVGVFVAVRWLQRRPFGTVLGAGSRLDWSAVGRGLVTALIVSALGELGFALVDPSLKRSAIGIAEWFAWLIPLSLLLLLQVSGEELAFRGYLVQSLAARFRSPLIWAVLPALFFAIVHWNGEALPLMNASSILTIAAFAALATALVVATGNLGAGIGVHLGMNVFSILGVSHMNWLNGAALFVSRPLEASDWTLGEAIALIVVNLATFAAIRCFC